MQKAVIPMVILNLLTIFTGSIYATHPAGWSEILLAIINNSTDGYTRDASTQQKYDDFKR